MPNTTAINSELFAALVTQAQYAAYENSVARQLLTVFDAPVNAGKVLQVPVFSSIAAELISDESAATAKDTNTTSATITLAEHVVYHKITDMLRDSAYSNVIAQIGEQSGRAIAESMDTQAFAQFANLTGAGDTAIALASFTKDNIMDRVAALRANKLTGPFYAVIHPTAANAIKKALTATSSYTASGAVADSILTNYFVGQLAGCTIIESSLVPYAAGTGIATCAVFASSAIGHAMRGTIEMEEQRQAKDRATDVVLKAVAGAATLQSTHGYTLSVDLVA
jgi:N4-gp56 family major capsid protein